MFLTFVHPEINDSGITTYTTAAILILVYVVGIQELKSHYQRVSPRVPASGAKKWSMAEFENCLLVNSQSLVGNRVSSVCVKLMLDRAMRWNHSWVVPEALDGIVLGALHAHQVVGTVDDQKKSLDCF